MYVIKCKTDFRYLTPNNDYSKFLGEAMVFPTEAMAARAVLRKNEYVHQCDSLPTAPVWQIVCSWKGSVVPVEADTLDRAIEMLETGQAPVSSTGGGFTVDREQTLALNDPDSYNAIPR